MLQGYLGLPVTAAGVCLRICCDLTYPPTPEIPSIKDLSYCFAKAPPKKAIDGPGTLNLRACLCLTVLQHPVNFEGTVCQPCGERLCSLTYSNPPLPSHSHGVYVSATGLLPSLSLPSHLEEEKMGFALNRIFPWWCSHWEKSTHYASRLEL